MTPLTLPLLPLLLFFAPAASPEEEKGSPPSEVVSAIKTFNAAFASKDKEERILALVALRPHDHELVVGVIAKRGLPDREAEVRDVAAQVLGKLTGQRETAGPVLRDHLEKNDQYPEVLLSICRAIGWLGYLGAREQMQKFVYRHYRDEEYRWAILEVMRTFGVLRDVRALPFLLRMAEYQGKTKRGTAGPEVYSKKGARDAKDKYDRAYGKDADPGGADSLHAFWREELWRSVKTLTGQEFEDTLEFRKWLKEHRKELGLDQPEKEKKEPDEPRKEG